MMACPYCIKHKWGNKFKGNNLKLEKEPSYSEVIREIYDPKKYNEVVFCGYGDALVNVEAVKEISKWIKENGGKVRVNTAGLANRYHGKNVLLELKEFVNSISISLNGSNPKEHAKLNNPLFNEESFDEIVNFAKESKKFIREVVITAIKFPGFDVSKIKKIAVEIGVQFRARPYLNDEN
jgi:TatD DNase family protein